MPLCVLPTHSNLLPLGQPRAHPLLFSPSPAALLSLPRPSKEPPSNHPCPVVIRLASHSRQQIPSPSATHCHHYRPIPLFLSRSLLAWPTSRFNPLRTSPPFSLSLPHRPLSLSLSLSLSRSLALSLSIHSTLGLHTSRGRDSSHPWPNPRYTLWWTTPDTPNTAKCAPLASYTGHHTSTGKFFTATSASPEKASAARSTGIPRSDDQPNTQSLSLSLSLFLLLPPSPLPPTPRPRGIRWFRGSRLEPNPSRAALARASRTRFSS